MKVLLLVALLAIVANARFETEIFGKLIRFNFDNTGEFPIGLTMSGTIDPQDDTNNKISTFLRLAGSYIPILENVSNPENKLTYERIFRINFAGIDATLDLYVQLLVGWRVFNHDSPDKFLKVVYTPFIHGWMTARFNGTTLPGYGSYSADLQFIRAYSPIELNIDTNKVCFGANYTIMPIYLKTNMNVALQECKTEIIDDILNQQPLILGCNFTPRLEFTHLDVNITSLVQEDIIDEDGACIFF